MNKHNITKFKLVGAEKHRDPYSGEYYMDINFRGEYRNEGFLTHTRCSPEFWADEREVIIETARKYAGIFVAEEEKYGYFETNKETD